MIVKSLLSQINLFLVLVAFIASCGAPNKEKDHQNESAIWVDAHNDVLSGTVLKGYDISTRLDTGNTDLVRLKEGGIGVQVFAVFGGGAYTGQKGFNYANQQIDSLYSIARRHPDQLGVAHTVQEAREITKDGRIAGMLGLEGGHMIDNSLDNLDSLARRGIAYMTLTWNNSNEWATSSADEEDPEKQLEWKGLTDFGKQVVRRMNELGVAVDVSHVGKATFDDVIEVSTLPVLASHSNARALCDVHRNLTDEQLKAVANTGGVVGVTFYAPFLDDQFIGRIEEAMALQPDLIDSLQAAGHRSRDRLVEAFLLANPQLADDLTVPIAKLIEHIDHIVGIIGIDHVGIGSDYFGFYNHLYPKELADATRYPVLANALSEHGYAADEIEKIMGLNMLRVLDHNRQKTAWENK